MNASISLTSTVRNVWIGDEHAIVSFEGSLPSNVGNATSANVFLFCFARDSSIFMCALPSSLKIGNSAHPFLIFDQSPLNPFELKEKHSSILCSYLASSGGTVKMTVKLDLTSLPDHVNAFKMCLQLKEEYRTGPRQIGLYSNTIK
jgi:hypothetical protein